MATTRRKSSRARKPKTLALVQTPIPDNPQPGEPESDRTQSDPQNEPSVRTESGGFLGSLSSGLKSLLSSDPKSAASSPDSATASPTSEPQLSAEAEAELRKVADVITDEASQPQPGKGSEQLSADGMQALMDAIAFEEQDVKDTLAELFDYLAELFDSEHWALTERQLRMLGRPSAQLLNSLWAKLKTRIPDILANWCETTPGATAFLMAFGLVVVPKATKQWSLSRERKRTGAPAKKPKPETRNQPIEMQPGPGGIPVAVGVMGDR